MRQLRFVFLSVLAAAMGMGLFLWHNRAPCVRGNAAFLQNRFAEADNDLWKRHIYARKAFDDIAKRMDEITDADEKQVFARLCLRNYLSMNVVGHDIDRAVGRMENYFVLSIFVCELAEKARLDDDEMVSFFFGVLGKCRQACETFDSEKLDSDYRAWRKRDNAAMCVRSEMVNILKYSDAHIFDTFLRKVSADIKDGVRKRFDEFHAATTQEVARAEAYRRSHMRSPPPILGPQAQRPQEPHGK